MRSLVSSKLLLLLVVAVRQANATIELLTSKQFYEMATSGQVDVMIDVRSDREWATGRIENATHVPDLHGQLQASRDTTTTLKDLKLWECRSCRVVVYCRSGARASSALLELKKAGFTGPLYNGKGVSQWTDQGYPLVFDSSVEDLPCMLQTEDATSLSRQGSVCRAAHDSSNTNEEALDGTQVQPFNPPGTTTTPPEYQDLQRELDASRDLFLTQLVQNNATFYKFDYTLQCFCVPGDFPWLVMVKVVTNETGTYDKVVSAMTTTGIDLYSEEQPQDAFYSEAKSIMDLFDYIQSAIDRRFESILVTFSESWGYPENIFVDFSQTMIDDEMTHVVTNFEMVEADVEEEIDTNTSVVEPPPSEGQLELDAARDLFVARLALHNATGYAFSHSVECFCVPADYPWYVTVRIQEMVMGVMQPFDATVNVSTHSGPNTSYAVKGDVVVSAITTAGDDMVQSENGPEPMSVLDLFKYIQNALDNEAETLFVSYDPYWGYPADIYVEQSSQVSDTQIRIFATNFSLVDFANGENGDEDLTMIPVSSASGAFEESRMLWNEQDAKDYFFQYSWAVGRAFDAFPWSIQVQNGMVVSAENVNGEAIMDKPGAGRTMNDIFHIIRLGLEAGADLVDVQYNETYGFPKEVFIDYSQSTADEELYITVFQFSLMNVL